MEAWISGVSARRAPTTIQRIAGMMAKVGVRTWTRAGLREPSFHETEYNDLAARSFDAAVAVPVTKANFSPSVAISPEAAC
jgi:hypothetical protein